MPPTYELLFCVFAFVLGTCIGSFLNVCIYRLPLDMSVNGPQRSFCPSCKYQIPWYHNIPLLSWLLLRGKCANCSARIAFRYFGVELLTGILFLAIWLKLMRAPTEAWSTAPWLIALPLWILASLLVVATFIDFEHFIIPDEITWGGAVAGVILSFAIPTLHGADSAVAGGLRAIIGGTVGYLIVWGIVEAGKLALGRERLRFEKAEPFAWVRCDKDADLTLGEEKMRWSDFFVRGNEQLVLECPDVEIDGRRHEKTTLNFTCDWLEIGGQRVALEKTDTIRGTVTAATLPREAMGFGDVKFMACIGAFLGWQAAVFTIFSGAAFGAVIGSIGLAIAGRDKTKIPFGPYLALGALTWIFAGPELIDWYLRRTLGP